MKHSPSQLSIWLAPTSINVLIGSCLIAALLADGIVDMIATGTIAVGCTIALALLPILRKSYSR